MKSITNIEEAVKKRLSDVENIIKKQNVDFPPCLTVEEVKYIYGSKGGLRLVLTQDTKKLSSKYKKVCEKIASKYRALKIETVLKVLNSNDNKFDKDSLNTLKNSIANLIAEIYKLEDTNIKFKILNKNLKSAKDDLRYAMDFIEDLLINIPMEQNAMALPVLPIYYHITTPISAGHSIAGVINAIRVNFSEKSMKKFLESEDGKTLREKINSFFKDASEAIKTFEANGKNVSLFITNAKSYVEFTDSCGALAYNYLKTESASKLRHIKKGAKTWKIDKAKLIFMSLVCICSHEKKYKTYGNKIYQKVYNITSLQDL